MPHCLQPIEELNIETLLYKPAGQPTHLSLSMCAYVPMGQFLHEEPDVELKLPAVQERQNSDAKFPAISLPGSHSQDYLFGF